MADLAKFNHAQRERLAFIEFNLQFMGKLARADLVNHFQIGLASCSRDLTLYRELAPDNMVLKHETKQYFRTKEFKPLFEHNPEVVLANLSRYFGGGLSKSINPSEKCIDATKLIHSDAEVIASLMRAINNRQVLSCDYVSLSSGKSSRIIAPHSIASNGQRWHVRAFDQKTKEFRDFVCNRLQNIIEIQKPIAATQASEYDKQWNNIVNIKLVVHPSIKHPKAVELDFGMVNGVLNLDVREALLGYLMRQWNVDCSRDGELKSNEHHLWLKNIKELGDMTCLHIAPGYKY